MTGNFQQPGLMTEDPSKFGKSLILQVLHIFTGPHGIVWISRHL